MPTLPTLVFDLDDTLYDEIDFVKSGFNSVSAMLESEYGIEKEKTFNSFIRILKKDGRGNIFDEFLKSIGLYKKYLVKRCLANYRYHKPKIALKNNIQVLLSDITNNCFLVTDGNKIVQRNKINAMNLDKFFKKIFITYQYGIKYSKPSLYCFKKIIEAEKAEWKNLVYIGDNPYKDFVNLNRVGAQTIRIRRGPYKNTVTSKDYDAKIQISNLEELRKILKDSFDEM